MQPVISQLEKALESKDEKEMRVRIEVLLDFLKSNPQPIRPYFDNTPTPQITARPVQPNHIMGKAVDNDGVLVGGEQITLTRPEGT